MAIVLGAYLFIRFYHVIRRLWVVTLHVAVLYEYEHGERKPIWEGWSLDALTARSMAQAERWRVSTKDKYNYSFEITSKEI